jgi:hypothetical protein
MHALRLSLAASLLKSCLALLCLAPLQQMEEMNQLSPSLLNQAYPDRKYPPPPCISSASWCSKSNAARSMGIPLPGEALHPTTKEVIRNQMGSWQLSNYLERCHAPCDKMATHQGKREILSRRPCQILSPKKKESGPICSKATKA